MQARTLSMVMDSGLLPVLDNTLSRGANIDCLRVLDLPLRSTAVAWPILITLGVAFRDKDIASRHLEGFRGHWARLVTRLLCEKLTGEQPTRVSVHRDVLEQSLLARLAMPGLQ